MTDVRKAEGVVASLEAKREACVRHGTELADERANVALSAHTGDVKARQRLNEINSAIAVHSRLGFETPADRRGVALIG
jgi:hypothetical protein